MLYILLHESKCVQCAQMALCLIDMGDKRGRMRVPGGKHLHTTHTRIHDHHKTIKDQFLVDNSVVGNASYASDVGVEASFLMWLSSNAWGRHLSHLLSVAGTPTKCRSLRQGHLAMIFTASLEEGRGSDACVRWGMEATACASSRVRKSSPSSK